MQFYLSETVHCIQNPWKEWLQMCHADVSWPPSEQIRYYHALLIFLILLKIDWGKRHLDRLVNTQDKNSYFIQEETKLPVIFNIMLPV